jgi:O-antigen/teichoic acid export membrane protein
LNAGADASGDEATGPGGKPTGPADGPAASAEERSANLRERTLHGGAYLAARELVGMVVKVLGVVVVTREIGPHSYGVYAGAAAFTIVVGTVAQMGMEVYLIRQPEEPELRTYEEVFTFLVALSVVAVAVSLGLSVVAAHLRPTAAEGIRVFRVLLISVPLNILWAPAQARIERAFGFKRMAWLELGGDAVLYATAVPLAVAGWGPYSLAVGMIVWQAWLLVGSYWMAHMLPRLRRPSASWFGFLRHGVAFSMNSWVQAASGLANPLVVGHFFGATGVGYVALASRLVDTLGFAQRATWRLGLVALSKVQTEGERARRGVEEGMVLQVLAVAVPIATVAMVGKWLIPFVFGPQWLPAVSVFALLGVARILNGPLTVQMALLFSRGRNQVVVVAGVLTTILIFGAAFLLVPPLGVDGYGVAAIISTSGFLLAYRQAWHIQPFDPYRPVPWLVALIPPVLSPLLPWPASLVLLSSLGLLVVVPDMRHLLHTYAAMLLTRVRRP